MAKRNENPSAGADEGYEQRSDPLSALPPQGANAQKPTAQLLLWAYAHGMFPMADPRSRRIDWHSPDPRGVIPLQPADAFHIPGNLAREVRRRRFDIRCNLAFEDVIRACAESRGPDNPSWLNERLIRPYLDLHGMGHAHSVEAWRDGKLVGGLYGVHIGAAFFGESMFSRPLLGGSNASKVCLVHLVRWLQHRGFMLLDTQFWNEHLDQFGCIEIDAESYLALLSNAVRRQVAWGDFAAIEFTDSTDADG